MRYAFVELFAQAQGYEQITPQNETSRHGNVRWVSLCVQIVKQQLDPLYGQQ